MNASNFTLNFKQLLRKQHIILGDYFFAAPSRLEETLDYVDENGSN